MIEYDSGGVMKWQRAKGPIYWPEAGLWVVADRHLPCGTREHVVQGSVPKGLVVGNANVIGEDDVGPVDYSNSPAFG